MSNVGHGDTGKPTPTLFDLDKILVQYHVFEKDNPINNDDETTVCYTINTLANGRSGRIDAHYYMNHLSKISEQKDMVFSALRDVLLKENNKPVITGGATPLGTPYVTEDEGIRFLRVQNIASNYLDLGEVKYIPKLFHEGELRRSQLKSHDVLLTITGTYGISAIVPEKFGTANINQHVVKMVVDKTKIDPYYLSVFLNTHLCRKQFDRYITGGTRPALDYNSILSTRIVYPKSLQEQRKKADSVIKRVNEFRDKFNEYRQMVKDVDDFDLFQNP
jgi:type I restriction enzyme, S subunit